ncbi:MAG: hypothetical protein BGO69_13525 [Bacteroidetes bacterium 46-16]|nr:MAG: hypothetical protein BGO69_13525 [Bacteroidetes bacterium 46-16]
MKQQTRELLVTTKVAQNWQDDFEQKIDELMSIVSKVDTEQEVLRSSEMLDVYHNTTRHRQKQGRKRKHVFSDRPFEFLVFRN